VIPAQRRQPEPPWCHVADHSAGGRLRHRSAPIEVGRRHAEGAVTAWLVAPVHERSGVPHVLVNACQAVGITVEISLDDAARFCTELQALLKQAGR
jgi:hypothetical protein